MNREARHVVLDRSECAGGVVPMRSPFRTQSANDARIASAVGVILLAVRPASTSTVRQSMNDQSRSVLEDAAKYGIEYLEGLDTRPVAPSAQALAKLAELDRPLGDRSEERRVGKECRSRWGPDQ